MRRREERILREGDEETGGESSRHQEERGGRGLRVGEMRRGDEETRGESSGCERRGEGRR